MSPAARPRAGLGRRLGRVALRIAVDPLVAVPGYWIATGAAAAWGFLAGSGPLRERVRRRGELLVAGTLPGWAFGRGGTTVGGVFLTSAQQVERIGEPVYEHEAVHREQWRRFGLAMIPLYLIEGQDPLTNRFEIEAGLAKGGYVRPPIAAAPPADAFEDYEPPA